MDSARAKRMTGELLNRTVGDWTITEYRAAGKSALVFKATRGGETAALKIFDPELIERFGKDVQEGRIRREISLRGRNHPYLIKILDGGHCPKSDLWFVAMEFIDAPNLSTVIQNVPRDRIWPIISQVASAARFLESLQLAHRDIKPDNIAVTLDFQHAVLFDLGVIRPFGISDLTDAEKRWFIGTLQYSSPEFLFRTEDDSPNGWRALTFYQLGAVLHDMIMRKRLFSEFADPFGRLVEAVKHEIPKVEAADVTPDLILLARNCLIKDPMLRLRLVHWEDFDPKEGQTGTWTDAKVRILKRRAQACELGVVGGDEYEERSARAARRILDDIQGRLQDIIRQECVGSDLFPPMEIHEFYDQRPDQTHFLVLFSASNEHALFRQLSVWFDVSLLDQQSQAIQFLCAAALGSSQLSREPILGHPPTPIFEGVFEESVIRSVIQNLLYPLLDEAQQAGLSTGSMDQGAELKWLQLVTSGRPITDNE